jgi:hypothetical protein
VVVGVTLLQQVDHLRRLAETEDGTTLFTMTLLNVLEDLAVEVDRLGREHPRPPDEGERFGTI